MQFWGFVIDKKLNWIGGNTHIVQIGDIFDRKARVGNYNDEDSELGIIDHNPTASIIPHTDAPMLQEKEILLCCRPILEGGQVGNELHCVRRKRKAVDEEKTN